MGNPNVTLNLGLLMTKELNYKGSFRYGVCLPLLPYLFIEFLILDFSPGITLLPFLWFPGGRLI
jgi:hypothetical protein